MTMPSMISSPRYDVDVEQRGDVDQLIPREPPASHQCVEEHDVVPRHPAIREHVVLELMQYLTVAVGVGAVALPDERRHAFGVLIRRLKEFLHGRLIEDSAPAPRDELAGLIDSPAELGAVDFLLNHHRAHQRVLRAELADRLNLRVSRNLLHPHTILTPSSHHYRSSVTDF